MGYLPDDFDPSSVTEEMASHIHALNAEMEAAGALFFAGGLAPASLTKTVQAQPDGNVLITDGPYIETKEHIGGFYILDAANLEEALEWGRKGVTAAQGTIELRQIFYQEG
ncbi:MAG TPA: YciI family protein [Fimbriimonadaceae bacterium]|nr:YciI family protein [Fimbriimonadaceae bacterium]